MTDVFECPADGCVKEYTTKSGRWYHLRDHHPELLDILCPTCGQAFPTEHGRNQHHTKVHGESLTFIESKCEWCGDTFEYAQSHRSQDNFRGDFCSRECSYEWQSENIRGETHPNYKGGESRRYGSNWKEQREKALERDNYSCRVCGMGQDRCKAKYGEQLHVHHVTPRRQFENDGKFDEDNANRLSNLLALCPPHHRLVETGRIECPNPSGIVPEPTPKDVLDF